MDRYLLAGIFISVGLLTKQVFIVPALPVILLFSIQAVRNRYPAKAFASFFLPIMASVFVWGLFSMSAWGGPFSTGYGYGVTNLSGKVWSHPLLSGLWVQFFSLDKGLFAHNPVFILIPILLARKIILKSFSALDAAVLGSVFLQAILYAKWFSPVGDEALGPRYLVVVIPVLTLLFDDFRFPSSAIARFAIVILVVLSIGFQAVQTCVKTQQFYSIQLLAGTQIPMPQWLANMKILSHKLGCGNELYTLGMFGIASSATVDLGGAQSFRGLNFWWWHLYHRMTVAGARRMRPSHNPSP